jgi:predicted SAM-dependent methyltransferase
MFIKPIIRASNAYGSFKAAHKGLMNFKFNLKLSLIHLYNYYFNRSIKKFDKLHFGCGNDYKAGFLNINISSPADVFLDARNKLPFKDESINYIYSSHFVEHLEHDELMTHLRKCNRILSPIGQLRMAIPDFEKAMIAYINCDMARLEITKSRFPLNMNTIKGIDKKLICYMDYLNRGIHEYGNHKIVLDFEKIKIMLVACGFDLDKISLTEIDESIDLKIRDYASFYVIATK